MLSDPNAVKQTRRRREPESRPAATPERGVPALLRMRAILDMIASAEGVLTVSEIARRTRLPKSSVHGLCATLETLGLLSRREGGGFRIGPHVMRWANAFVARADVVAEFATLWDSLDPPPAETVALSVLDGADVAYLTSRAGATPLPLAYRMGMRLPAAFTATGKAMLATRSDAEVAELMANRWPQRLTPASVGTLGELLAELAEIRRRGFSVDEGQVAEGLVSFGAVVLGPSDETLAAVVVSLPREGLDPRRRSAGVETVLGLAAALSRRLGADPSRLPGALRRPEQSR